MSNILKTYEAELKPDSDGVFSISLVNEPATTETFIALSNQVEIKLSEIDKEQRILMGLVLQPDQLIYRKQDNEEFNIVFSADTIKELSHNFLKSGFQLNSKLEHEAPIKDISIVESWLVENPKIDKSYNFGMEYPKGSWIATMKIDNDDIWNNYVKTGKVQGFSVDAMVNLKEINLKTEIEMAEEKKTFTEQVNDVLVNLGIVKETKVELGSVTSGETVMEYEGETLEVGTVLFVTVEEERVAIPDGEYPTEMGTIVIVDSIATEIKTEVEAEAEAPTESKNPSTDEITQAIKSLLIKYSDENELRFKALEDDILTFKKENETLKTEVVELSKAPASKPIKSEIKQVELNAKGRLLEKLRNNKN